MENELSYIIILDIFCNFLNLLKKQTQIAPLEITYWKFQRGKIQTTYNQADGSENK